MPAIGSVVARHEQSSESGDACMAVFGWCMGHMPPSPWPHVHVVPIVLVGIVEHSAAGTNARIQSETTSQPPVRPAACERIQPILIAGQGYHAGQRGRIPTNG